MYIWTTHYNYKYLIREYICIIKTLKRDNGIDHINEQKEQIVRRNISIHIDCYQFSMVNSRVT
jgi:hypothetical protein